MVRLTLILFKCFLVLVSLTGLQGKLWSQGKVVINEFMAWSGCSTTSEFIELMNFGPGPMDIGCYIVTNGQYAVTIPSKTILQPGQYYLISGQNTLAKDCGNTDSLVNVDLNWTNCNCTDKPVPTTGDGFFKDGGNANEKVVLFDRDFGVVDAVSRQTVPSTSVSITTSTNNGYCDSRTFDLDLMSIRYESINNSTGIDNSFARKVDGDCGWVKTTAISAQATNKTGSTSSATYSFSTLSASECNSSTGKISIQVNAADVNSLFPMSYTLGFDSDANGIFDEQDLYTHGVDSLAPSIDIANLAYGRYRITVGSALGCNLQTFNFFIFNCYGLLLSTKLLNLQYVGTELGDFVFDYQLEGKTYIKSLTLEGSTGTGFRPIRSIHPGEALVANTYRLKVPATTHTSFRLKAVDLNNAITYSPIVQLQKSAASDKQLWPNPATTSISISWNAVRAEKIDYALLNSLGVAVGSGVLNLQQGVQTISLTVSPLSSGIYQLQLLRKGTVTFTQRFVKY